jgi:hypothetical protein
VVLALGSNGEDGLWWYYKEVKTRTNGSKARAWVQPPYPIHSQRITIDDADVSDPWGEYHDYEYDGVLWAWKAQVGAETIRIVGQAEEPNGPFVQIPYVWKSQLDFLDADFQDTKGSAVIRFYLADDTAEGLWQVWPPPVVSLLPEEIGLLEGERWLGLRHQP